MGRWLRFRGGRAGAILLLFLLAEADLSCSSSKPRLYPVRGRVLSNGRPVDRAMVTFHQAGGADATQKPIAYTDAEGQFRLTQPLPLLGLSLLAGIQVESGRMKKPFTEPNLTGWLNSYGVYLSTTTAFGPAYFGYSNGPDGKGRVYLFLGTP